MYEIIKTINLDQWYELPVFKREPWLRSQIVEIYRAVYDENQRIVFTLSQGDEWVSNSDGAGLILQTVQKLLNQIDISNYFVIIQTDLTSGSDSVKKHLQEISTDPIALTIENTVFTQPKNIVESKKRYEYNSKEPINLSIDQLPNAHKKLLVDSKTFCIYPWIHIHAYPTGEVWPCCQAEMKSGKIGDVKKNTLEEIWNNTRMKTLRTNMLNDRHDPLCTRCYEQEDSGFFSGRQSANKHHGHHINRVNETKEDGHLERFELTHWDIRFSNLCNLRCRSCGHIFSSQWYQDQVKLAGKDWAKKNKVLNIAGRSPNDMWEQLEPHLDYVEQIYFAGGEPLLMEEHYRILDELDRRGMYDVRLIYNTNFTHTDLKGRSVFEYWKKFKSVSVGASLDGMGAHAEYIRKGTVWADVERNREQMMRICPQVDFYVSATMSILNALHLPDFHRAWVEQGFIRAQDFNVNILQDPAHYRIDIAHAVYKKKIQTKYQQHLEWLRPQDQLQRATVGFESAVKFLNATDNSNLYSTFWRKTRELDDIRNERLLDVIPELGEL